MSLCRLVSLSPEPGVKVLVLKVIGSAEQLRLAGHTFIGPAVVRALAEEYGPNVDLQLLIDDNGNHGRSSLIAIEAMNLVADAGTPIRIIGPYAASHHDK